MQIAANIEDVLEGEVTGVDQNPAALFREDWKGSEYGAGKRFLDGAFFDRVARGAEIEIAADEKYSRAEALESHHPLLAGGPPIEPPRVRAESGGERVEVEEILVEAGDLEEQLACPLIEVEWNESIVAHEAGGLLGPGSRRLLRGRARRLLRDPVRRQHAEAGDQWEVFHGNANMSRQARNRFHSAATIADARAVLSSSFAWDGNVSRRRNSRRSSNMLSAN